MQTIPPISFSDRVIFSTGTVEVGAFRCSVEHPEFRTDGPIRHQSIVFPRTAVWIQHAGRPPFVADPRVVAIYNVRQEYVRDPLSPDGDRADWFGVTPRLAFSIARDLDPAVEDPDRPFRVPFTAADSDLYLRQRSLFVRLERGELEPLEAEQSVIELMAAVIERAHRPRPPAPRKRRVSQQAHRDLAERARAELSRNVASQMTVTAIASRLGVSPYHLCRVFRAETGSTLHAYRLDVRLSVALERLADRGIDLSQLALDLGFCSHSHFTWALRRRMSVTPSAIRALLAPPHRSLGRASKPLIAASRAFRTV